MVLGWTEASGNKPPSTIRRLLKHHVDLRSIPTKSVLKLLSSYALNSAESSQLKQLAINSDLYESWKVDQPVLIDVLRAFPSINVDSSSLVYMMKTLQPR